MNRKVSVGILAVFMIQFVMGCKDDTAGPPPQSSPDTTSHDITWQTDSMGYYSSRLLDVWGSSDVSVYAVGYLLDQPPALGKYFAHYDGRIWTAIQDDSLSWWLAAGLLAAIHGLSDTTLFVAGSRDHQAHVTAFVGRWNGKNWTNISPPDSIALLTIWVKSRSDIYAGGESGTILHYDGTDWLRLQTGTDLDVWQITGFPNGEIYAVASSYFNSLVGSVIFRIDGNTVSQDQLFAVGRKFGIWGTMNSEAYATGEGTFHRTNGFAWQEITTPNPGVAMWSVTGTGSKNVFVAGAYGAVMHWSGSSWKFYDELYDRSSSKSYFKAFAIGNKYFLVGNTPSHALISVGTRDNP